MAILSILVFAGRFALAMSILIGSLSPQWQRIVRLAMGHVEPAFTPLATLAVAERRIAVRRWASQPIPAPIRRLRAAA